MLDDKQYPHNEDDNVYGRFFLLRMLFKHIELFNLWKSSIINPKAKLYGITLELLEEMQRLEPLVKIKHYKKVDDKFALSISDLAKVSPPKEALPKFYFYLYVLHRKLLESLSDSNLPIKYSQAMYLHFITNEIIDKVCSSGNSIKASMYKREVAKLKETFAKND